MAETRIQEEGVFSTRGNPLKLYMKNLASERAVTLDANILSLSESLGAEWSDEDLFGRSEEFGIYVKGTRDFVMSLNVYVDSEDHVTYFKYIRDFMNSCTRPKYGGSGNFIKGPLVWFELGASFAHYMKITSINISYDPLLWDTNNGIDQSYLMFMVIDINGRIVHEKVPDATYEFYEDSMPGELQPVGPPELPEIYSFISHESQENMQLEYITGGTQDTYTLTAKTLVDSEVSGHTFEWYDYILAYLPW